jgi:hypothetical protein
MFTAQTIWAAANAENAKLAQSVAAAAASPLYNLDCSNLLKPEKAITCLKAVISSGLLTPIVAIALISSPN